jgi:hypothetical protein
MSSSVLIYLIQKTNSTLPQQNPKYIANSKIKGSSDSSESKGQANKGGLGNHVKIAGDRFQVNNHLYMRNNVINLGAG